jgi:hypothetical protein
MNNSDLSHRMQTFARDQERQGANLFQVRSYRVAAGAIARLEIPLALIYTRGGRPALEALPGIGKSVAYTLEALLTEGEPRTLERPDRGREPLDLLSTLPGVGFRLAEQLHDRLGIHSLDSLIEAGADGRLESVGVSGKRLTGLMAAVRARLETLHAEPPRNEPSLALLLELDEAYRNQNGSSWDREGWRLRAHYADTALAHRRGMSRNWVVIEYSRPGTSGQRTIVTESEGDLAGNRVVRGREIESRQEVAA